VTGLDTSVLARYLTEDDPAQARKAAALIQSAVARGERCFISAIVLCELSWVLRSAYKISKADLLLTLDRLVATTQFVIGSKDVVRAAIELYRAGRADFADYVIGALHRAEGCDRTATFDRRLRGAAAYQVL
jgi:predicted nucleic-acid-binding protein